ncbi:MAG: hypothetical protein RL014_2738 [Pseudomonadota bacterium]|jgi:hypothetical protein
MATGTFTIDGKTYQLDQVTPAAREALASLRAADLEIQRKRATLSMLQTARNMYAHALKVELGLPSSQHETEPNPH